jgi:hypothetical protein
MEDWLTRYKAVVLNEAPLDDSWFQGVLSEARQGDDVARRRILGSSLKIVLEIVERSWKPECGVELVEMLQDANRQAETSLKNFTGQNSEQYVRHLEQAIKDMHGAPAP